MYYKFESEDSHGSPQPGHILKSHGAQELLPCGGSSGLFPVRRHGADPAARARAGRAAL